MPVNAFAIPRMEQRKQRPVQSMEEAPDWERSSPHKFLVREASTTLLDRAVLSGMIQ
jgi:hypothetical protein